MVYISADKRAKPILSFLDENVMNQFTDIVKKICGKKIVYLVSFPRSGNGWIRYMVTEALLLSSGVNLDKSIRKTCKHNNIIAHCIETKNGYIYNVEDFFPDYYAIDKSRLKSDIFRNKIIDENCFVYIKTHHLCFRKDVKIVYLIRNPKDAFISYFNLINMSNPLFKRNYNDAEFKIFFKKSIRIYSDVYVKMFDFYREKIRFNHDNISFIRMEDIAEFGSLSFKNLIEYFGIKLSENDRIDILKRNPKLVDSSKTALENMWDEELNNAISDAEEWYKSARLFSI